MERARHDDSLLFAQIRRSLLTIAPELRTAQAREEFACIDKILALMQAERELTAETEEAIEDELDDLVTAIRALLANNDIISPSSIQAVADGGGSAAARIDLKRQIVQGSMPALADLAAKSDTDARVILTEIQAIEVRGLDELTRRRAAVAAETITTARGAVRSAVADLVSPGPLEAYLRAIFPDEVGLRVADIYQVPGGRSKQTAMITLENVTGIPARVVMRSDIPGGLVPSKAVDEFPLIRIADRHGVPVPTPLHCEPSPDPLGRSFIIMEAMPGRSVGDYFPELGEGVRPEYRATIGRQLAQILARLHGIGLGEFSGTHLDLEIDLPKLVMATIEATCEQARTFDSPSRVLIERSYVWLKENIHLADDVPCLIHCDVGLHNMLVEDDRITAMLDWELACVASPAREIAKILHLIDYLMPREDFYAEYRAAGGPSNATDAARINYYAVMNYMVTNQRARFGGHLFYSGQQRNIVLANVGYDSFIRNSALLANALAQGQQMTSGAVTAARVVETART